MNRRTLLASLPLAVVSLASAQDGRGRIYRIGFLWLGTPDGGPSTRLAPLLAGLRERGYVEGRNLVIAVHDGQGDAARLAGAAAALAAAAPDVIVTVGTGATLAAKAATGDIPIVFGSAADPVGRGIVASLARPGGNVTGLVTELTPTKTLEALKDVLPTARRVGFVYHAPNIPAHYLASFLEERVSAARALGMELLAYSVPHASDLDGAFADLARQAADAVFINQDSLAGGQPERVTALALRHRLPTVCHDRLLAEAGCLVAYGEDMSDNYRTAAGYVDRILKGARPGDLPIEQPTKFALIVNTRTAQALGLAIPPAVLAHADAVIE